MPGDREELQPGVLVAVLARPPLRLPPGGAAQRDDREVRERLHRVHQRRLAVQAVGAGERRLVPRLAAVPFHALDERRLLAEDVTARRSEHFDVKPPARAARVRSDQAGVAQALDLTADDLLLGAVLVADEHPAFFGADREHAEQHALEHQVRLGGEDVPVFERAGLGLVGVADHILGRRVLRRHQVPLAAGREPGAAHAAQPAVLERSDDLTGIQVAGQHRCEDPIAVLSHRVRIVRPSSAAVGGTGRCGVVAVRGRRFLRDRHRRVRRVHRDRRLVHRAGRRDVAPAEAGSLDELDVGVGAVALLEPRDPLVRAAQPAGQVVADPQLDPLRRVGAEVRVERDQPLDLVQRPVHVAGQRHELLAGQPADPFLDRVQRRDQARAGELASPGLDAWDADLGLSHRRAR